MFKYTTHILISLFLLVSCKAQDKKVANSIQSEEIELVMEENYSGFDKEQLLVIKDQISLNKFFGVVNRTRKPGLATPAINFKKDMLLIWCGGSTVTLPQKIIITNTANKISVEKISISSKKNQNFISISPFQIYRMPLSFKSVQFK